MSWAGEGDEDSLLCTGRALRAPRRKGRHTTGPTCHRESHCRVLISLITQRHFPAHMNSPLDAGSCKRHSRQWQFCQHSQKKNKGSLSAQAARGRGRWGQQSHNFPNYVSERGMGLTQSESMRIYDGQIAQVALQLEDSTVAIQTSPHPSSSPPFSCTSQRV